MIGEFVWSGREKRLEISVFFFFFFLCCGLLVVVAAAAAAVADGRSGCGCGWCCENFLGSWIYYFIVVDILFYCSVYIILLY